LPIQALGTILLLRDVSRLVGSSGQTVERLPEKCLAVLAGVTMSTGTRLRDWIQSLAKARPVGQAKAAARENRGGNCWL